MIIRLKDINKTYPGVVPLHVLKDINLDIERGELVSIMGASGSAHLHGNFLCGEYAGDS